MAANLENHIILPDGRRLAYAEYGKADGLPVMYFHGSPSSRLEPLFIGDEVWTRSGLRVIAADRPGMGLSDPKPRRGFADWPGDVTALADALELDQFSIIGYSGGAAYAAICAARIPERLKSVVIVSGGWRMDWPEARENLSGVFRLVQFLARRAPWLLRLLLKAMAASAQGDPTKELERMKSRFPAPDYAALAQQPERIEVLGRGVRESMRQGTEGPAWDMQLYVREFDFAPAEIKMPIQFFHGESDANVPIALIQRVVRELPSARLTTYPNEAHLSTLCNHIEEIAAAVRGESLSDRP